MPSRGSALTEEVRQEDWHEDDFRVGSPTVFSRGLGGAPAAMSMLRVVLNLFFRILGLLGGRLLVDQACVACTASALVQEVLLEKGILQSTFAIVRAALITSCVGSAAVFPQELGGTPAAAAHFSN